MRHLVVLTLVVGAAAWAAAGGSAHVSTACGANSGVTITQAPTVSGGVATVGFSVASGCDVQLSLVSYTAPSGTYSDATASQQVLFHATTDTFSSGSHTLSVQVPSCFFQLDFVYGTPIEHLGPAGSSNFYGQQGRLLHGEMGGSTSCSSSSSGPPPTTVTICHATGVDTYTTLTASADVVFNEHLGKDAGDIIPPFTFNNQSYMQNWTSTGQATFGNGCKVVAAPTSSNGGGNGHSPSPSPPQSPATVTVPPPPAPTITFVKTERVGSTGDFTAGPVNAKVGDTVYYQLVATDTGTTNVSVDIADPGCGSLLPTGPQQVSAGASITFTCSHTLTASDGPSYTNTAVATATNASPTTATAQSSVVANVTTGGVAGASKSVTHKKKHRVATHRRVKKLKKVTHKAKAAHAVIAHAHVTG